MVHGQSQLNAVALLTGLCLLGASCQPGRGVMAVVERQELSACGVFMGSHPALPPRRVDPALPTAPSSCRWLPASVVGVSVHCFS